MHALTHPCSATSPVRTVGVTIGIAVSLVVGLGVAIAVPFLMSERWWHEGGVALALAGAAIAGAVDAGTHRIPDRLVLLAALPIAIVIISQVLFEPGAGAIRGPLAGAIALSGPLLVLHLVSPAAIGFGDVKLAAVLGAALGTIDPRMALVALGIASAATAAFGIVRRRPAVPLGPGLVAGSLVGMVATTTVLEVAATWR